MAEATEQFAAWQRAAIDSTIACAQAALTGAEQLLRLNLVAARTALEQHAQAARELLATSDPQELMHLRSRLAQQTMQQAAAYAQDVYELVSETQAQLARQAEQQFERFSEDVLKPAQQAGPGAEVAVAAVKSSLAASAAMMDNLNRATKQFADLSEATIRDAAANMVTAAARPAGPAP